MVESDVQDRLYPRLCFHREAGLFLHSWMASLRVEQLDSGTVPMIVPYLKAHATFLREELRADTNCGWGGMRCSRYLTQCTGPTATSVP